MDWPPIAGDPRFFDRSGPHSLEAVAAAARKHHKMWGLPAASSDMIAEYAKEGAQLINRGGDYGAVMMHLRDCSNEYAELSKSGVIA